MIALFYRVLKGLGRQGVRSQESGVRREESGGRSYFPCLLVSLSPCLPNPCLLSLKLAKQSFFLQLRQFALVGQLSTALDYRCKVWGYLEKKAAKLVRLIRQIGDR